MGKVYLSTDAKAGKVYLLANAQAYLLTDAKAGIAYLLINAKAGQAYLSGMHTAQDGKAYLLCNIFVCGDRPYMLI